MNSYGFNIHSCCVTVYMHVYAGLNNHFHMVCIQHKLQQSTGLPVSTDQIWAHLRTLYDIDSLVSYYYYYFTRTEKYHELSRHVLHKCHRYECNAALTTIDNSCTREISYAHNYYIALLVPVVTMSLDIENARTVR